MWPSVVVRSPCRAHVRRGRDPPRRSGSTRRLLASQSRHAGNAVVLPGSYPSGAGTAPARVLSAEH